MVEPEGKFLHSEKLIPRFTKKDSEEKWKSIALSSNSIPGGVKSNADWKIILE